MGVLTLSRTRSTRGATAKRSDHVDFSRREVRQYSLCRAILAATTNDWSRAGFEQECSRDIEARTGKPPRGFYMPSNLPIAPTRADVDAMELAARRVEQAARAASGTAYAVTTGTTGGSNLVATSLLAESFIEVLRNKAKVLNAGARVLSGLVGNVNVPRRSDASTAYWLGEGADIPESEGAFDHVVLSPKTLGVLSQITRTMMMQSTPEIDDLVRRDMAAVMALGIDSAALVGTGANGEPLGILNTPGIQTLQLGTGSGGPLTFDAMTELETLLAEANVPEASMAYMTNAKQVGALKLLKDNTGKFLWTQYTAESLPAAAAPGEVNGYPVIRTNQIPSNLGTNSNLSAVILANWSEVLVGEWGALDILPNPYGVGFNSGTVQVRAMQSIDIGLRHPVSFAAITDAV